jgi:hypothetical protein
LRVDGATKKTHLGTMSDTPKEPKPDPKADNETMREVKRAKARKAAAEDVKTAADDKSAINWKTAAGVGIGSAALVAALMYAKARKKDD